MLTVQAAAVKPNWRDSLPSIQSYKTKQPAPPPVQPDCQVLYDQHGDPILLDPDQQAAVKMACDPGLTGCVITGNAGVGKTTTTQAVFLKLLKDANYGLTSYRVAASKGERWTGPSIACVAASNKAVRNMRKKVLSHPELQEALGQGLNITTVHNLLEYTRSSTYSEAKEKEVMCFVPTRHAGNPLDITHLIVEEASMVGAGENTLWSKLWEALPPLVKIIFLGDICQIPPIGGKPILSYALKSLPTVELTHIHRQALESPIIRQAYACLQGKPIQADLTPDGKEGVQILTGNLEPGRLLKVHDMKSMLARSLPNLIDTGRYSPADDIILCPYNVSDKGQLGTQWLNAVVASHLAKLEQKVVHEIKTGYATLYLALGDKVLVNKTEGIVTAIRRNNAYFGRPPKQATTSLDYFGHDSAGRTDEDLMAELADAEYDGLSLELVLATQTEGKTDDEQGRAASHNVEVELDDGTSISLGRAGHFSPQNFSLGYAISIHKAQGSEWPRVFVICHDSHRTMLYRELLYTAMTRAQHQLILIGQAHVWNRCAKNPRIKGNSLADKIEFFNGGYLDQDVPLPGQQGQP